MRSQISSKLLLALVVLMPGGCSLGHAVNNEIVMCPGASIVAQIGDTSFAIKSTSVLTREIQTGRAKLLVTLIPRAERWSGSLGLYNPDAGDGRNHVAVQEGVQHFSSIEEARDWIAKKQRELPLEYTSDGLVVAGRDQVRPAGFEGGPDSATMVEIWRLLVNGAPPTGLQGSHNERFKNVSLPPPNCTKPQPFVASSPKEINGRRYSGRAVDLMKEGGIKSSDIEELIRTGKRSIEGNLILIQRASFADWDGGSDLVYVEVNEDGTVVDFD